MQVQKLCAALGIRAVLATEGALGGPTLQPPVASELCSLAGEGVSEGPTDPPKPPPPTPYPLAT